MSHRTARTIVALVFVLIIANLAAPALADETIHVVRPGETLFRIARAYGTSVQAIVAANGIANPNRIFAGQRLVIPGAATQPPVSTPPTTSPSSPASAPAETTGFYTVRPGDTLFRIARQFGTTTQALAAVNGIANPNRIFVGQQLRVGGGVAQPAAQSVTSSPAPTAAAGGGGGVTLAVSNVVYHPEAARVDMMVTVRNNSLTPAIASGNWYPKPNADGGRQWVTLLKASHQQVPVPLRGDAPLWEFIVTTNDGLRFSALAGCRYEERIFAEGREPTAEGGFYWSTTLEDGWFDCGNAYQVKPPVDLAPGQSATVPLHIYLTHPRNDPAQAAGRRVARLDFIPYAPSGASFGVQASYTLP